MVSFYSIVQYAPDPVRNERVNIGVVAFGDGRVRPLFLQNWHRVKQFAGKDVSFLKEVSHDAKHWDEATVNRLAAQWTGTVQLTKPSVSTLAPDELLVDAGSRYLVENVAATRGYRVKTDAVRIARSRIREKLIERFGAVGGSLLRNRMHSLQGKHMAYKFDVSVSNGHPFFAAQAISFEVPGTRFLDKEISATAWLIEDVKRETQDLPIAVMALPPVLERANDVSLSTYKRAAGTFRELGAEVVLEAELAPWAKRMVELVSIPNA